MYIEENNIETNIFYKEEEEKAKLSLNKILNENE